MLIQHGANPNIDNDNALLGSVLSTALADESLEFLQLLLQGGLDPNVNIPYADHEAPQTEVDVEKDVPGDLGGSDRVGTRAEGIQEVKGLWSSPADAADQYAIRGRLETALFRAACYGDARAVQLLLDGGAMIDLRNGKCGETALFVAFMNGKEETVRVLLDRGAQIDKSNVQGITPLMIACETGRGLIVSILLDKGADPRLPHCYWGSGSAMITAIACRKDHIVQLLLENGISANTTCTKLGTLLRAATIIGHKPTILSLIKHKADLNAGFPLLEALRRGPKDVARLLITEGANVNAVQRFYHEDGIPLWIYWPFPKAFARVIAKSLSSKSHLCLRPSEMASSVSQDCIWEDSPLWVAAAQGDEESVILLLEYGADPMWRGPGGSTAQDIALVEEHHAVVQLLVEAGKDMRVSVRNTGDVDTSCFGHSNRSREPQASDQIDPGDIVAELEEFTQATEEEHRPHLYSSICFYLRDPDSDFCEIDRYDVDGEPNWKIDMVEILEDARIKKDGMPDISIRPFLSWCMRELTMKKIHWGDVVRHSRF